MIILSSNNLVLSLYECMDCCRSQLKSSGFARHRLEWAPETLVVPPATYVGPISFVATGTTGTASHAIAVPRQTRPAPSLWILRRGRPTMLESASAGLILQPPPPFLLMSIPLPPPTRGPVLGCINCQSLGHCIPACRPSCHWPVWPKRSHLETAITTTNILRLVQLNIS